MPENNFEIAPPARDVDGLHAVPIDIRRISARLTFDGATHASKGDATVEFTTAPESGCPIFDLRQTITGLWLDGSPMLPANAGFHDFGGGSGAELRVLSHVLPASSHHVLRVTYAVGVPQASTAGSYLPAVTWTAGPRLQMNFGFTDLGPGRYVEGWIPANLIFDQYEILLELQIINTVIAHSLITNGAVTSLGVNHWSVTWPAHVTAFSPLVELHATDTVVSQTGVAILPGGVNVTIRASKLTTSTVDLEAQITALKGYLFTDTSAIGPYMHGSRFTAHFAGGGMEYDGATTTSPGSLRHETHHSWWGRGVKPASQNDGWLDEAWTVYVTEDLTPLPFSNSEVPVELCSQNPWVRATPVASYTSGARFFQGLASLVGDTTLRNAMAAFYKNCPARPITTLEFESHLLSYTGQPQIVDAFHRWIYGFEDSASVPDLSLDLWMRNFSDGGTEHQNPVAGHDNWFYARVRNVGKGSARHLMVTFALRKLAGTEFVYPNGFLPSITASGGFELAPGASAIIHARCPAALMLPAGSHSCLLASVHARSNHPARGRHVSEENALAQKNLTIVSARPTGGIAAELASFGP